MSIRYSDLLRQATQILREANCPTAAMDARLLLQHLLDCDHAQLIGMGEQSTDIGFMESYMKLIDERAQGKPVHRIIGQRDFYGLQLELNSQTLVPRPDTECLVDMVLDFVRVRKRTTHNLDFADLGTGSGAVGLVLVSHLTNSTCVATDISPEALETASKNSKRLGLSHRFSIHEGDWYDALDGEFDFLVSNPPYISHAELETLDEDVIYHDPIRALDGGEDGLNAYRSILDQAPEYLKPDGFIAVEIGFQQKQSVIELARDSGLSLQRSATDLAGHDRCLLFTRQRG